MSRKDWPPDLKIPQIGNPPDTLDISKISVSIQGCCGPGKGYRTLNISTTPIRWVEGGDEPVEYWESDICGECYRSIVMGLDGTYRTIQYEPQCRECHKRRPDVRARLGYFWHRCDECVLKSMKGVKVRMKKYMDELLREAKPFGIETVEDIEAFLAMKDLRGA